MNYRDSASYGKRQEFRVMNELLQRNYDVYQTLVDDQGIDCIIRINHSRYLDVQVKARSKMANVKDQAFFPAVDVPSNRDNMFYIFYSEGADCFWVFPSEDIIRLANTDGTNINQHKGGINIGRYSLRLAGEPKGECVPFPRFDKYKNAFELLK